jgi:multisubunit Na+/H+ antiporter MnhE subunit
MKIKTTLSALLSFALLSAIAAAVMMYLADDAGALIIGPIVALLILFLNRKYLSPQADLDRLYTLAKIAVLMVLSVVAVYHFVLRPIHNDSALSSCLYQHRSSGLEQEKCFKQF